MTQNSREQEILRRIQTALNAASAILKNFNASNVQVRYKPGRHVVTEADHAVNDKLHRILVRNGEGWLSEESPDDFARLNHKKVWIVDPLDGTREFLAGIPEWCVSIALVENGIAIAGGICNPVTSETFLGSRNSGLKYNATRAHASQRTQLKGALVLSSRSETRRGEWNQFQKAEFTAQPMGSVAYKLARVAVGSADATWTLVPKNEWDVAAGVALVEAGGGVVRNLEGHPIKFNNRNPRIPGLVACGAGLYDQIAALLTTVERYQ